ncbi:MAG: fumarylacetoacetase [Alphaproteobacteria bacterium]|nr:fumarylacetoacetase [Alphaproteobacteria bacterium]
MDATRGPGLRSWVATANHPGQDFPIQNLPFGIFSGAGAAPRGRIAIGEMILDLRAAISAGLLAGAAAEAAAGPSLNALMALGRPASAGLRAAISALLAAGSAAEALAARILVPMRDAPLHLSATVANFSDFMASHDHCARLGERRDPKNPLPQAFRHLPVAYHSRASSVRVSGEDVIRPHGQWARSDGEVRFGPSEAMDYELGLAIWITGENKLGMPITMAEAPSRIFGFGLLNDWSARDIQRWEMPPLGLFLAKSVSTSVSPWVIAAEALEPFAKAAPAIEPSSLPYLDSAWNCAAGALGIRMQALLATAKTRAANAAPALLTDTDFARMYWTVAQMVAHHGTNGCNLLPGDLLGSGTALGPEETAAACLAELGLAGPITLPNGETRRWLQDGDEVIFRARAEAPGAVGIGFGECRGAIAPAIAWPV